ncbi:MAG: ribonuclease [Ignavibacteria bacterium]|nr:ribonuclease [Ignavibacteria bacterium]
MLNEFIYEQKFIAQNQIVAGIDEAGRGALAGPVVAAACILPLQDYSDFGIDDSKKLSPKKRFELYDKISAVAVSAQFAFIDNETIDKINILQSTFKAMEKAVRMLAPEPHHLLIDGNRFKEIGIPYTTIIGGDAKCISIAAASIIAKAARDRWMLETEAQLYPQYHFESNKGYGTKSHIEAIKKYGLCPLHRRTFVKWIMQKDETIFG